MKILITGSSSGVGEGLANYYLNKEHQVLGISRSQNKKLIRNKNFSFRSIDLSSLEEINFELDVFLKDEEPIDLIILNAGILSGLKDMYQTNIWEIKSVMDVNVWCNKMIIDFLIKRKIDVKQIVAISSGASVSGARGWNAYAISKAALNMLVSLYAKEAENIHFCALAPGLIDTKMQDYICSLTNEEKFPVIKKLKKAKGTDLMPDETKAAEIIAQGIEKSLQYPSGSFLDVRNM